MPGTFAGYEIASRALGVSQTVMDVIGHNVANINTPGYSRQIAHVTASDPYSVPDTSKVTPGQFGTGVVVSDINHIRDAFVDQRLLSLNGESGTSNQLRDILDRVQAAYGEPGTTGVSSVLTAFFNRFQDLSRNPENTAIRVVVKEQGQLLANRLHEVYSGLTQLSADLTGQVQSRVNEANDLGKQVANLNSQIAVSVAAGDHPNDLLDKRDEIIRRLGTLVGAITTPVLTLGGKATGAVNVLVNGHPLVQDRFFAGLPTAFTSLNGVPQLTDGVNQIPVTGGEVSGLVRGFNLIATYQSDLNSVASTLISAVNAQHAAGYGLNGSTGKVFFSGSNASNIAVDAAIQSDVNNIAAASPPISGSNPDPGNGDNALAIANLANAQLIGVSTIGDFYGAKVAQIGQDAQSFGQQSANLDQVGQQLRNLQSSTEGVSLDEELAHMMQYQRTYQAASRLLTTQDTMIGQLLTALGA